MTTNNIGESKKLPNRQMQFNVQRNSIINWININCLSDLRLIAKNERSKFNKLLKNV